MEQTEIEKKAEEYVMREDVVTENDRAPLDNGYGWQTVSFEDEVKQGYKDGHKDGYKDGYKDGQKHKADKIFDEWCSGTRVYPRKCGYLKSLEAQIPQWHDLRKNPDDLPTTEDLHNFSKCVLCALKFDDFVFYQVMSIHYPSKTWIVVDSDKNYSDKNVIAWCELPKFEE